jgi:hypothetical protein
MRASFSHLEIFACGLESFFMFVIDDFRRLMKNTKSTKSFESSRTMNHQELEGASKNAINTNNKVLQTSDLFLDG